MTITVEDRFEQYLMGQAWQAGLRKPDEVAEFVDYWRTTAPAQRELAGLRLQAAVRDMVRSFGLAAERVQAGMLRFNEAVKARR